MASLEKRQERDSGGRKYCAIVVKVLIIPIHQKVALLGIWNAKRSLKIPTERKSTPTIYRAGSTRTDPGVSKPKMSNITTNLRSVPTYVIKLARVVHFQKFRN